MYLSDGNSICCLSNAVKSASDGSEEEIARAFNDTIAQISARVTDLKTIAEQPFTPESLRASLANLGAQ